MIWLFKNGEGKLFNEDEVKEKMAEGWILKRDRTVENGNGTTLYKRLKGEIVEGQEPQGKVIIESDLFPNELVAKKLQDGWYKTKEDARYPHKA